MSPLNKSKDEVCFQKKSQYLRQYTYQTVTRTNDPPNFDMGKTGYGRIYNNFLSS